MDRMKTGKSAQQAKAKMLHHIEVRPSANGGHIVTHHFDSLGLGDNTNVPEMHIFGEHEGPAALEHIEKHARINVGKAVAQTGESESGEGSGQAAGGGEAR